MNNEELKPCPFCGGEAEPVLIKEELYIRCRECGAVGANTFKTKDVIAAWNRRVCVKENATGNYPEKQDSSKLTYADVEKMVKPLEWTDCKYKDGHCYYAEASIFDVCFYAKKRLSGKENKIETFEASIEDFTFLGEIATLETAKSACQDFLVSFVATALGVERWK